MTSVSWYAYMRLSASRRNEKGMRTLGLQQLSDVSHDGADNIDLNAVVRWALPVSPLVAATLSVLSYTLSPVAEPHESNLYLVFFAAALIGYLSAMLVCRAGPFASKALGVVDAVVLECAFAFFMLGYPMTQPLSGFTWSAVAMTGYSAASLLMLWLPYQPSSTQRTEMFGFAVAFFSGFLIRVVQILLPPLMIGFLFPLATAIPLLVAQCRAFRPLKRDRPGLAVGSLGKAVPLAMRFVLIGMGMGLIGNGAHNADYSAGLLTVLLIAASLYRRVPALRTVTHVASALMVIGFCMWLLPESGAPFAVYLAGCGSLTVCLLCSARGSILITGVLLSSATVFCLAGIAIQQVLVSAFHVDGASLVVVLIMAMVAIDAVCRMLGLEDSAEFFEDAMETRRSSQDEKGGARELVTESALQGYRLSAREREVAAFLLENRSVGYICASLGLSQSTVKTHIRHIYGKLDIHSKDELQLIVRQKQNRKSS